jgi:ATP-dependent Clp protease ATP-binding subunit ClpB
VDFRNVVVIMTSNVGSTYILENQDEPWHRIEAEVTGQLREHFRPEFLNRVDDIVVFRPLHEEQMDGIMDLQLARLGKLLADRKLSLDLSPEARRIIAREGYDPAFGARPLKRAIQRYLQNPLAMAVLEGRFTEGDRVRVGATRAGELTFDKATDAVPEPEPVGA